MWGPNAEVWFRAIPSLRGYRLHERLGFNEDEVEYEIWCIWRNDPLYILVMTTMSAASMMTMTARGPKCEWFEAYTNTHGWGKVVPPAIIGRSPFSRAILESPRHVNIRHHPELPFDGVDDPTSYYMCFNIEMYVYRIPSLTRCRLFSTSLHGRAQLWFSKLTSGIIRTWEQMGDLFRKQFQSSMWPMLPRWLCFPIVR